MKVGIVTFPGSNCDDDLFYVLKEICNFKVELIWHKEKKNLEDFDLIALPGGFSFGDYLRCGAIASVSYIIDSVREFSEKGLVLGICNGFQILCEMGLLPGALIKNREEKFICKDVFIKVAASSPWTMSMNMNEILVIPIAHSDGRFIISEEDYVKLKENGQILFEYCDSSGDVSCNPNGSLHSIAGICNATKNVCGLMPHPERASDLRSGDGMKFWHSIMEYKKLYG